MMNDNQMPEGPHHAVCLTLLRNLRDQLDLADKDPRVIVSGEQETFQTEHFAFWRKQIDWVLTLPDTISDTIPDNVRN